MQDARRFLEHCPDLLWDMSYSSAMQRNLRASDFCRLGKCEGHPTYVLYQELLRAEEILIPTQIFQTQLQYQGTTMVGHIVLMKPVSVYMKDEARGTHASRLCRCRWCKAGSGVMR